MQFHTPGHRRADTGHPSPRPLLMRFPVFILAMLCLAPLACTSPSGQGLDEREFNERIAEVEWQARQSEQQPGMNPKYPNQKTSVFPQPVEDPLNTGRDLERPR